MRVLVPSLISLAALGATGVSANPDPKVDYLVSRDTQHDKRGLLSGLFDHLFPKTYNISFYHVNDVHAHLDEFRSSGSSCTDPTRGCVGGYSRIKSVVSKGRRLHKNSLFLNAGDEFQGTLFHSLYRGYASAQILNQLDFDAMTLGNHEFDEGDDVLANFIQNLTFPVIASNIETNNRKLAKGLIKYKLFPQHSLGIVAVTTDTTPDISNPGPGTTFTPPVQAVQETVNYIKRKFPYIKRLVALTHIGYDQDILLARQTRGVNLIIGGHSHTLLGSMAGALGPYPTIEKNLDNEEVFVVTSYRWGEYLGYIDIAYDRLSGKIVGYTGAPIHLTNTTAQDAKLQKQVDKLAEPFGEFAGRVLGVTLQTLVQSTCQTQECTLGDFTADAILAYRTDAGAAVDLAIMNAGGIRAEIDPGNITLQTALEVFPFGNTVVELTFTGADLWKILEGTISRVSVFNGRPVTSGAQWSSTLRLTYNPNNEVGRRVISIEIGGEPLDPAREYRVATIDFLAGGGDNFWEPGMGGPYVALRGLDDVWAEQVGLKSPLNVELDGRYSVTQETVPEYQY
ncbi:hypothetical protein AX16_010552 [Volvariella volvacea WC 439]|nr:hypothetical protein AX16_010552 [Volvariella volvacea WC 439]